MQINTLGRFGQVSRLTLGGGGIGQVWGPTSVDDAVATLRHAVSNGIDLIDAAPGYKICEAMIGRAFEGRLPTGVRVTTKYGLGTVAEDQVYPLFRASLQQSLREMRLERVDMLLLHTELRQDEFVYPPPEGSDTRTTDQRSTSLALYRAAVIPAFERLMGEGLIGAWGITGINQAGAAIAALQQEPVPYAVQEIANLLDSPGEMNATGLRPRPREVIAAARSRGVGVMGVRAVQAGALTRALDRADNSATSLDFARAAGFRALCDSWGQDPALTPSTSVSTPSMPSA